MINAYDSIKALGRGKSSTIYGGFHNFKKDSRLCTYCSRSGHCIDVCYRKHRFPPSYDKKRVSDNASNASNGDAQLMTNNGEEGL